MYTMYTNRKTNQIQIARQSKIRKTNISGNASYWLFGRKYSRLHENRLKCRRGKQEKRSICVLSFCHRTREKEKPATFSKRSKSGSCSLNER